MRTIGKRLGAKPLLSGIEEKHNSTLRITETISGLKSFIFFVLMFSVFILPALAQNGIDFPQPDSQRLHGSDSVADDEFGRAVAITKDTVAIGAPTEDGEGNDHGAVYIFQKNFLDRWVQTKRVTPSDPVDADLFGRFIAIDNDVLVVGLPFRRENGLRSGVAYVFERDFGGADNWGEAKKLVASDLGNNHRFGAAVAVDGETILVTATRAGGAQGSRGAAYAFERNEGGKGNWGESKKFFPNGLPDDLFGSTIGLSGDTAVVGASQFGGAYVFDRNEGGADNWGEVKQLTQSMPENGDDFGRFVDVSGNTIVASAHTSGDFNGSVYVYERDEGGANNWGEVKILRTPVPIFEHAFGSSLAIDNDLIIVGSDDVDTIQTPEQAYIFERDFGGEENWGLAKILKDPDGAPRTGFGEKVAISGSEVVVGAQRALSIDSACSASNQPQKKPSKSCATGEDGPGAAHVIEAYDRLLVAAFDGFGILRDSNSRPLSRAYYEIEDENGVVQRGVTNGFGYFFYQETAGQSTYTITVRRKEYFFGPTPFQRAGKG